MKMNLNQFEKGTSRRILSLMLAVCMVFTMSPPITAVGVGAESSGVRDSEKIVLSGFAALPDEVREQSVSIGTSSVKLNLPDTLEATEETPAPKTEVIEESIVPSAAITVEGVTWESDPIYDSETAGTYTFTAVLPDGYATEDGESKTNSVGLPTITVTVGQAEQSAADKVIAMIDALPSYAELTADPPGDSDPTYPAWLAKTQQTFADIRAAKAAYDALTDEEKALVDEARTNKLIELAELAEQMALMMPMADNITSGTSGGCNWVIDADYQLIISPTNGGTGTLAAIASQSTQPWKSYKTQIKKVTVESGVISNEDSQYLFQGLSACTEINVSQLDTSNVTDMASMFNACTAMTTLIFKNPDTKETKFTTSKVTDMNAMFLDCKALTSLDVSGFSNEKVRFMNGTFGNCTALETLTLSDPETQSTFNTAKVETMTQMFYGCSTIKTLDLRNFSTAWVSDMSSMFKGCTELETITFDISATSKFTAAGVSDMSEMFSGCTGLKTLDLSMFTSTYLGDMSNMFNGCAGLKSINFGESGTSKFTTAKVSNMSNMFSGCTVLEGLNLSMFTSANLRDMSNMFKGCAGLKFITFDTSVTSKFTTAAVTNMSNMFSGCKALQTLNLSKFTTAAVTNMSGMFEGCTGLTSIDFDTSDESMFTTEKVTNMKNMFSLCSGLKSLNVSKFNTGAVTTMAGMFVGCSGLTTLDVSNFTTATVTDMSSMFTSCSGLKALDISNFVLKWGANVSGMFYDCTLGLNTKFYKRDMSGTAIYFYEKRSKKDFANDDTGLIGTEIFVFFQPGTITTAATNGTVTAATNPTVDYKPYFEMTAPFYPKDKAPAYDSTKSYAQADKTVEITAAPNDGYVLDTLTVTKTDDPTTTVNVTNNTFVMPAYDVTVTASFKTSGYPVIISAQKDDEAWSGHDKTFKLLKDNTGSDFVTDLTQVQDGAYAIYETDGTSTGVMVTVSSAEARATVDYYTVIFYDGATACTIPAPQVVLTNGSVTMPDAPTKTGYTFAGWKTANNGTTAFDFTGAITEKTSVYASWTATPYTVTLNGNDGTGGTELTSYTYGIGATLPTNWTKAGYTFGGWYDNSGLTGSPVTAISDTETCNKAYWAKWTDGTAPTISVVAPSVPTSGWFTADLGITLTYSDNESVTALAVSVNGANYTPITLQNTYTVSTEGDNWIVNTFLDNFFKVSKPVFFWG